MMQNSIYMNLKDSGFEDVKYIQVNSDRVQ